MTDQHITEVDPAEADRMVREDNALLVDCRELQEWNAGRIPGAVLKPMSTVNDWYQDLPTDRPIVMQCRSGNRSGQIVSALVGQVGMANVMNLAGGILAWHEAGLPIEE
jgi:rhodanese-related sulfurtransferase